MGASQPPLEGVPVTAPLFHDAPEGRGSPSLGTDSRAETEVNGGGAVSLCEGAP